MKSCFNIGVSGGIIESLYFCWVTEVIQRTEFKSEFHIAVGIKVECGWRSGRKNCLIWRRLDGNHLWRSNPEKTSCKYSIFLVKECHEIK